MHLSFKKFNNIWENSSGSDCQKSECSVLVYWLVFAVPPVGDTAEVSTRLDVK